MLGGGGRKGVGLTAATTAVRTTWLRKSMSVSKLRRNRSG